MFKTLIFISGHRTTWINWYGSYRKVNANWKWAPIYLRHGGLFY